MIRIDCPVNSETLRADYTRGRLAGLSDKYNVGTSVARRWLTEAGIEVHGKGRPTLDLDEYTTSLEDRYPGIVELIGVETDADVARGYGLSRERVRQFRARLGVRPRT